MSSQITGIQLIKDYLINLLLKGIIEGFKIQILVVADEENTSVAIKIVVEGGAWSPMQ